MEVLASLAREGVSYWSYKEPYLDSSLPFHNAVTALIADVAAFEKKRVIERIQAGLTRARETGTRSGKPIGRPRADLKGYSLDVLASLRAQGVSWSKMADVTGVPATTVRRVLTLAKTLPEAK